MNPKSAIPSRVERRKPQGPWHDFWLLPEGERSYADYRDLLQRSDPPIRVSDDVVHHLNDTLRWIPTLNPSKHPHSVSQGLNLYGVTVIAGGNAARFSALLLSWANLFEQGPELIELSHGISEQLASDHSVREYVVQVLQIDRNALLRDLRHLGSFGEKAAAGESYVLHLGI